MTYGYTVTTLSDQKLISTFQLIVRHEQVRRQAAQISTGFTFQVYFSGPSTGPIPTLFFSKAFACPHPDSEAAFDGFPAMHRS